MAFHPGSISYNPVDIYSRPSIVTPFHFTVSQPDESVVDNGNVPLPVEKSTAVRGSSGCRMLAPVRSVG